MLSLKESFSEKSNISFEMFFPDYSKKKSCNEKVVYNGLEYEFGIRFHNVINADIDKSPIICIGTEICNSDVIYEDRIVGWLVEGESTTEVLISQMFADTTTHPVFIVVNGTKDLEVDEIVEIENKKKSATPAYTGYKLEIIGQKITEAYDSRGKQEYNVSWVFDSPTYDGVGQDDREHIADLDDLNTHYSNVFRFYEHHAPQGDDVEIWHANSERILVGATYEYDWFASLKELQFFISGQTYDVDIRASEANEYYQKFSFDFGTTCNFYNTP